MDANSVQNISTNLPISTQTQQIADLGIGPNLQKVQKADTTGLYKDKDAVYLSLSSSLDARANNFFANISSINNIFAVTQIAQKGLDKQEDILAQIKDKTLDDNEDIDVANKRNDLISLVKDLNTSIQKTTYNNDMILSTDKTLQELTFSTQKDTFFVQTPDMQKTLENIAKLVVEYDGSKESNEQIQKEIDKSLENISMYSQTYSDIQGTIRGDSLQNLISNLNINISNSNTYLIDYGKDSNDFNKNNISSQLGYLAASQANILQEQASRLLV